MSSDPVLLRIASSAYAKAWCRGYRWEDLRDAVMEQSADDLLRLGERDLEQHVAAMMGEWERRKFERQAVEAGEHSALVAGVL